MKTIETQEFTLPSYWSSYLINGDPSGLESNEKFEIDAWCEKVNPGYCIDCSKDSSFACTNDANSLGGEVSTFTFHKFTLN